MSSLSGLQARLKELSAALDQIHQLVDRLRDFTPAIGQGDDARLELGAEIHGHLKDLEDEMELLRVETDALETLVESRRKTSISSEKEAERERVVALANRLAAELKKTRVEFRNAQLQAKRNAETAKRKEREILLARSQSAETKPQRSNKLTQEDLEVNASSDVTMALRRTHQLMQAELSRSQFAQQTLEQSSAALASLSESYTGLDTLLSSSRNLLGTLLRSQKSDTWYLETAFYILIGTIIWLIIRRWLYGPLWLVWMPFKLLFRSIFAVLGAMGITSKALQPGVSDAALNQPSIPHGMPSHVPEAIVESAIPEKSQVPVDPTEEDRMIDQIGRMAEDGQVDDLPLDESTRQEEIPRNPKKRMMEAEPGSGRDEL